MYRGGKLRNLLLKKRLAQGVWVQKNSHEVMLENQMQGPVGRNVVKCRERDLDATC